MAEGSQPPVRTAIHNYYINIGASEETTTTVVHGDQVQTKHEIRAEEIGAVTMSPGKNVDVEEPDIAEEVRQMNLGEVSEPRTASDGCEQSTAQGKPMLLDENKQLQIIFLKERCSALLGQSEYQKASTLLEEIGFLQSTMSFDVALQMAECYLYIGIKITANEAIECLQDIIMTSQLFTADEVYKLGCELLNNSSRIRAIILLRIASDMYETIASSADEIINDIYSCIYKTDDAVTAMIKAGDRARILGVDYGIEYMKQMLQKIKIVKNANPDNKALKEALAMNMIGYNLSIAGEYEKSLETRQTGVKVLEQQFGPNLSKYNIYGALLHNIGVNLENTKRFSEAAGYYKNAIEAKEKATNYSDESAKQKAIEFSKTGFQNTRTKLGKN